MDAIRAGATAEQVHDATKIDPWFVDQLFLIHETALQVAAAPRLTPEVLRLAKRHGFSDLQLAEIRGLSEDVVRGVRQALGIRPVYKTVDTCAAEFAALTPYHYSSYDEETEVAPRTEPAVLILGSGPNRIGQGIEFDYSCVHAAMALRDAGYDTVMVNCNPETVSTDYDTSDRLYFEPLTCEDVLEVVYAETAGRPGRRRHRAARRPDPARAGPAAGRRRGADRRHLAGGDPPGRGPGRVRPGAGRRRAAGAEARHRDVARRGAPRSPTRSATRCWSGRRTCSAGAGWRSCTTTTS